MLAAGATAVVVDVRDGDQVLQGAAGVADIGSERPAEADDPVRIASITKAMTATVVMQLVEEGALTLDDTVDALLPGILPSPAPVTVRQLLDHTSGIPEYIPVVIPDAQAAIAHKETAHTPEELIDAALTLPWTADPGTEFHYANTNYVLLGLIIESITDQSVADTLQERIFEPAGMLDTVYPDGSEISDEALRGYLTVDGVRTDLTEYNESFWSSGAAVVSTVGDVATFFRELHAGRLVSPDSVTQMQQIGVEGYGFGILAGGDACGAVPPELVYGQRGNGFGYNSMSFGDPSGERMMTLAWTGGTFDPATDPITPAASDLLITGLAATCS